MTTVPAAIAALCAAVTSASTRSDHLLYGVQVVDGQPIELEPDVIVIGFHPERNAVEIDRQPDGLVHESETYDVACLASSASGDTDPAAVRERAFELFAAVADEIAADRSLDDTVTDSRVHFTEFDQYQSDTGAVATVAFNVRVSAFL